MLIIAEIGNYTDPVIVLDEDTHNDYKKSLAACIGLYIDGDNVKEAINVAIANDYKTSSLRISTIQTMTEAVSVFNTFFDLIVGILICACIFVMISFGIKNVRSNMYEIGVLKALGCKFSRFVITFMMHTLIINVLLLGISTIGFYFLSNFSNTLLTDALQEFAPYNIVLNINFIEYDFGLICYDNLLIGLISIISTLIPMIMIKRIKPISIIKAKE
jgi:ABC-type lipoprotein release transport system permease subunit